MRAITVYGVVVLVFMMAMYALEGRLRRYAAARPPAQPPAGYPPGHADPPG